jgi:dihydrofolate reductase
MEMAKIVVAEFVSLDGVMGEPQTWSFPYWGDDIAKFKLEELFASGAHLLGRVTYEGFAQAWPGQSDEAGFAERMNNLPKYVVSTTLENPTWQGTTVIKDNVVEELKRLKAQPGEDILVAGSATLVQTLAQNDLVDEYHLLVYPVVLGDGKRLFQDGTATKLKLVESKTFASGVQAMIYQPDRG